MSPKLQKEISAQDNAIDWQRVGDLAHAPRALAVPITGGQDRQLDSVMSAGLSSWRIPSLRGSNWDGKTGLLVDEKTFNDLVGGQSKAPPITQSSPVVH